MPTSGPVREFLETDSWHIENTLAEDFFFLISICSQHLRLECQASFKHSQRV